MSKRECSVEIHSLTVLDIMITFYRNIICHKVTRSHRVRDDRSIIGVGHEEIIIC